MPAPPRSRFSWSWPGDYLAGGLFDRAEEVLLEMLDQECEKREQVIRQLTYLYEQERDWTNAISMGERLVKSTAQDRPGAGPTAAARKRKRRSPAASSARRAACCAAPSASIRIASAPASCRGAPEMREEDWNAAIEAFRRIWKQDPDFFDEVLTELRQCYQALEKERGLYPHARRLQLPTTRQHRPEVLLLSEQLRGGAAAIARPGRLIADYMQASPTSARPAPSDRHEPARVGRKARPASPPGPAQGARRTARPVVKPSIQCRRCGSDPVAAVALPQLPPLGGTIKPRSEGEIKAVTVASPHYCRPGLPATGPGASAITGGHVDPAKVRVKVGQGAVHPGPEPDVVLRPPRQRLPGVPGSQIPRRSQHRGRRRRSRRRPGRMDGQRPCRRRRPP